MSGAGKTHWSSELAKHGFTRYGCDDLIEQELRSVLMRPDGSMMQMGEWMGLPFDPQHAECEARYLEIETLVTQRVLSLAESSERVVIDTTGSVIYVEPSLLEGLAKVAKVVYIETPPDIREDLCRAYMAKPLAVVWHGQYQPTEGESTTAALLRCYPKLIESRVAAYEALADVRIGYWECRDRGFTVQRLLERIDLGSSTGSQSADEPILFDRKPPP